MADENADDVPRAWYPRVAWLPLRPDQLARLPAPQREEPEAPRRTVTCGKCGERGHSSRGCKK